MSHLSDFKDGAMGRACYKYHKEIFKKWFLILTTDREATPSFSLVVIFHIFCLADFGISLS